MGCLYASIGDHGLKLHGPDGDLSARGSSGVIARMNPDGTHLERLVQGMRVPYSFEMDPFGQLWVLSNGEGNPNRFLRVIDGVDYLCYTRQPDYEWLAGRVPLAPPCFELPRGAHTQLMRYYGGAFTEAYQGTLLLDNWGAHGFSGSNRAVFSYQPDARGQIVSKEPLFSCKDSHFRPSSIVLDRDGNLLIADWYGRDDESDMTGRIWRLKYTGPDKLAPSHRLDAPEWSQDDFAISGLSSPQQTIREHATKLLLSRGDSVVGKLSEAAATAPQPLGAASALWTLVRMNSLPSQAAISSGAKHPDPRVRRLTMNLLRRFQLAAAPALAEQLKGDPDPAVRVSAALGQPDPQVRLSALVNTLMHGAAADPFLRYEIAWHLAELATPETFSPLLASDDADVRLAGQIALDVAIYENFPSRPLALAAIAGAEQPRQARHSADLAVGQIQLGSQPGRRALATGRTRQPVPRRQRQNLFAAARKRGRCRGSRRGHRRQAIAGRGQKWRAGLNAAGRPDSAARSTGDRIARRVHHPAVGKVD